MARMDYGLLLAVLVLVVFGLIIAASASSPEGSARFGDPYYYAKRQLFWGAIVGLPLLFIISRIPYVLWKKYAGAALIGAIILLVLVLIPGVGTSYGQGATRWLNFGPISVQPTEVVKPLFLIYLAAWLTRREKNIGAFRESLLPFLVALAIIALLVMMQPDLGTLVVISLTAIAMYFAAGGTWPQLLLFFTGAAGGLAFLIRIAPYRMERFLVFLHPELDPQGIGYQVNQALLAIGSGGLLGLGLGHSRQKFNYLPEPASDSIFAIVAEELGFFRTVMVILIFLFIAWRGYQIAKRAPDTFSRLLAAGLTTWIILQAVVNICALLSLVPLTGIPLPFVSLGGTALAMDLLAVGILLNISRASSRVSNSSGSDKFERRRFAWNRT